MRKIKGKLTIFLVPFSLLFSDVISIEPSQCIAPLGMENGIIQNQDITASSSYDHGNVGPHHGRIRNELNGGAWCPQAEATPDTTEWIEIDLHTVHMITATETQGRFGNGQGVEYAESYVLEYFRPRLNRWVRYCTKSNGNLLKGNVNTYLEEKTILDPPIWASKIRFLPHSPQKRTVCMRVEIYGCRWSDGVVSYTMPQGDKKGPVWKFFDFAYDGQQDGDMLKHGLGQLVDGQTAPDDFKLPFQQPELQSWIGWKSDNRNDQPIEIVFEFDKPREFRAIHIYANNQITREVQVFSVAKVFFSVDGKKYKGEPIRFDSMDDRIFENARNVSVKLHHRVGRFVKLQLDFAERWILVSEVSFESSLVSGNFSDDEDFSEDYDLKINDRKTGSNIEKNKVIGSNKDSNLETFLAITLVVLGLLVLIIIGIRFIQLKRHTNLQRPNQVAEKHVMYAKQNLDLLQTSSDYADPPDADYAVPLQAGYTSPHDTRRKPSTSSASEQYYADVNDCKLDFIHTSHTTSPPLNSARLPILKSPPKYSMGNKYIGA